MKESRTHLIERMTFPVMFIVLSMVLLYFMQKKRAESTVIIAKQQIISNIKKEGTDSAIIEGNKALKALETEQGLDSLISNIK